jgi:hypothetical protein
MYQLKSKGEYNPHYFNITNLSFILLVYLFHGMYKWFPLKEKFFFSSFSYFPVILCSDFFFQFQIQNLGVTSASISLRVFLISRVRLAKVPFVLRIFELMLL